MNKMTIRSRLQAGLLALSLTPTLICSATPLDLMNPAEFTEAEIYANQLPTLDDYDYSDFSGLLELFGIISPILTEDQQDLAFQYIALKQAGAIRQAGEIIHVDPLLVNAFQITQKEKRTPFRVSVLARAYASDAFQNSPTKTPEALLTMAEALEFGIPVQQNFRDSLLERVTSTTFLEAVGYWAAPRMLRNRKPQASYMLDRAYDCNANVLLYNVDTPLTVFASTAESSQSKNLMSFLQACKVPARTEAEAEKEVENPLQTLLVSNEPLARGLQKHAAQYGLRLSLDSTGTDYGSTLDGLYKVIDKAKKLPGALYFIVFKGPAKYQYGTFGVYGDRLNFSYVVDDHSPTPILNFSVPLTDQNEQILVNGIYSMMNGVPDAASDMMDRIDSVWLVQSQ